MPGGLTLASWGPWDDLGTMGSTTKDTLRSRLGSSSISDGFRNPIFRVFGYLGPKKVYSFMLFGFESGCLGLENQAFGKGGIAKINFRRNWISYNSRVHFS